MSDEDSYDYRRAMRELQEATNELRKLRGEAPEEEIVPEPPFCSFCGKGKNEYRRLVQGPEVYICDECVLECIKILDEEGYVPQ